MISHLLVFDRSAGALLRHQEFTDRTKALKARFAAEREFKSVSEVEVVVLNAQSTSELRSTHRRYFSGIREILREAHA